MQPAKQDEPLNERSELFFKFCARAFGTDPANPLVFGDSPINGATIGALIEAFRSCYPQDLNNGPRGKVKLGLAK